MNVLTVRDARKAYGDVKALNGAAFELRSGELLGLLGPNGAGKTTLIRAIAGRLRLDAGEIKVFDEPVRPEHTHADLGIVPQEVALYPLMTVRENLEIFGALQGLAGSKLKEHVGWALEHIGLADRVGDRVRGLSGGMRRRLNIGCGIIHKPRIILLDEPTVGVDPQSRDRIYEMLARLMADGVSVLLTTHHLEEAEARCSRIVIIDHGRAIAAGTLPQLVAQTVGRGRRVSIRLADGRSETATLADVASELPSLVSRIAAGGTPIDDIEVRSPSLQAVFIHLTGREIRE